MDFSAALNQKQFFRFTGPPEHWLTAIKYFTWGLEDTPKNRKNWERLQTGDVFFIHSSAGESSAFPKVAESGIIGIGVIGFDFSIKNDYLWHYEIKHNVNRWPLLIPLTEIYLFSELPDPATWESPTPSNDLATVPLVRQLVKDRVPISQIKGFPQMGGFSSVRPEVAQQILSLQRPLYLYSGHSMRGSAIEQKPSDLAEVHNAVETLRSAASLRFLDNINQRLIKKPYSLVERDNNILARAEESHYSILDQLISMFRKKGYDTLSNKHVDLYAHNENRSFLIEVKSTENKNFRVQARKGIVQLYEYDYFEINKFKQEKSIDFKDQYRILVPSQKPTDKKYVEFINFLDLGVAMVANQELKPVGKDFGFSKV